MTNENLINMLSNYNPRLDLRTFVLALVASLLAAFAASLMYKFFYERRGTGSQVHRAFPLLAISVTTLFIGVQVSLPLSLGLLGALSIVRFRVPIKEPEEVGFIMLVISSAICAATSQFRFILILYVIALFALAVARGGRLYNFFRRDGIFVLTMKTTGADGNTKALDALLAECFGRCSMESASARDGTTSLQYVFSGLKCTVPELQEKVARSVDLISINVFLDRPGGIR